MFAYIVCVSWEVCVSGGDGGEGKVASLSSFKIFVFAFYVESTLSCLNHENRLL